MNNPVGTTARLLGAGLRALLALTVICGVLYPLAVTGISQAAFPDKANGSEIRDGGGRVVGSSLIGQTYDLAKQDPNDPEEAAAPDLRWFQPRPSLGLGSNTVNRQYSLLVSGATNEAADNPDLVRRVTAAKAAVVGANSTAGFKVRPEDVPADAVTSSGSGLDPDISLAYAELQIHRVAERNHLDVLRVKHVLELNTALKALGTV
ncbi:potassium-transporting ATPase subunit C [Streptomyces sp. NPDC046557]|uniref:potassium-transporting ATPase subunit C n=1 Tax=Streptomyces sp. NPDC046557 TaxID=3155372 RepID=UPI0033D1CDF2